MPPSKSLETRAVQDFLKAVYLLQGEHEAVSTNALAEILEVSAPSVSDMAARLSAAGLVHYRKHYGVALTQEGEQLAHNVLHRHECIERFLMHDLGYTLEQAHEEAERMEHAVSERFVTALEQRVPSSPAEQLIGVTTRVSERVEFHRSQIDDNGVGRMIPTSIIDVAPDSVFTFSPGVFHMMLIDLLQDFDPGDTFPITLMFASGSTITTNVQVVDYPPSR